MTLAQVRSATDSLTSLPELALNFLDRQRIRRVEDKILDLKVIFDSHIDTFSVMQRHCRQNCLGPLCEHCSCLLTVEAIEEQINEIRLNVKRADILHKRVQGIAQIVSSIHLATQASKADILVGIRLAGI